MKAELLLFVLAVAAVWWLATHKREDLERDMWGLEPSEIYDADEAWMHQGEADEDGPREGDENHQKTSE